METKILPVLDTEELQKQVSQAAMDGAIKSIKEFYTGYNSPYRKKIDELLSKQEVGVGLELPDIIALINDKLSNEIDVIANAAVAKSFVPMVQNILTREEKEMKFSEILEQFIKATDAKHYEECDITINKEDRWGWLSIEVSCDAKNYSFTLHESSETKDKPEKKYQILGLPYGFENGRENMKVTFEGGSIEMPFTRNVLSDKFVSFVARLVLSGTQITMDTKEFSQEMFPERCHCD